MQQTTQLIHPLLQPRVFHQHLRKPEYIESPDEVPAVPLEPTATPISDTVRVSYELIAPDKWSATYENAQGDTEQITNGQGNWKKAFDAPRGSFLYLSAQNSEDYGGYSRLH
ncbi:MAG TPA: hypothetical protein VF600_18380 [Abditibacteriaceae bacterium]|jgi:hypothetical protein